MYISPIILLPISGPRYTSKPQQEILTSTMAAVTIQLGKTTSYLASFVDCLATVPERRTITTLVQRFLQKGYSHDSISAAFNRYLALHDLALTDNIHPKLPKSLSNTNILGPIFSTQYNKTLSLFHQTHFE